MMIIHRGKTGTTIDGELDLLLLRRPHLFELKGQPVGDPHLTFTHFRGFYRGDDWRSKWAATKAALKFIWRGV
jgi:hypothetical protein